MLHTFFFSPDNTIDELTFKTDKDKCTYCCRCIAVCPEEARAFKGLMYAGASKVFALKNPKPSQSQTFFTS